MYFTSKLFYYSLHVILQDGPDSIRIAGHLCGIVKPKTIGVTCTPNQVLANYFHIVPIGKNDGAIRVFKIKNTSFILNGWHRDIDDDGIEFTG